MDIPKRSKTDHCVLFLFFSGKTRAYVYVQRCWKTPTCCRQYIQDINWNKMIQQIHRISRKSVHKAEICLQQGQWSQFHPVPVSGWNRGARLGGMPGMEAPFRDLCDANMCKCVKLWLDDIRYVGLEINMRSYSCWTWDVFFHRFGTNFVEKKRETASAHRPSQWVNLAHWSLFAESWQLDHIPSGNLT